MEADMTIKELLSVSPQERCEYYRQKIAERQPPKTEIDKRLIHIYESMIAAYEGQMDL